MKRSSTSIPLYFHGFNHIFGKETLHDSMDMVKTTVKYVRFDNPGSPKS